MEFDREFQALERLRSGGVIPAHPLALNLDRTPDWKTQEQLTRYYIGAGAIGLAVGVHTTQFEIRERPGLLSDVLVSAANIASKAQVRPVMIAGVAGNTEQAVAETTLARESGYDFVLLAPYGAGDLTETELVERTRAVGEILPVIAFYLQPSVGGRLLSSQYWKAVADLDCVVGIKAAPFDRYETLALLRGVALSSRAKEIVLYTGNDDHIIGDLLSTFHLPSADGTMIELSFIGGLLGQWAVWTRGAVRLMEQVRAARRGDAVALRELMTMSADLTDANRAIFDADNNFSGCLPGIHDVLRRQGLLVNTLCLDPEETLSAGQADYIAQVWGLYPHLRD